MKAIQKELKSPGFDDRYVGAVILLWFVISISGSVDQTLLLTVMAIFMASVFYEIAEVHYLQAESKYVSNYPMLMHMVALAIALFTGFAFTYIGYYIGYTGFWGFAESLSGV